jgi:hypothetical protein
MTTVHHRFGSSVRGLIQSAVSNALRQVGARCVVRFEHPGQTRLSINQPRKTPMRRWTHLTLAIGALPLASLGCGSMMTTPAEECDVTLSRLANASTAEPVVFGRPSGESTDAILQRVFPEVALAELVSPEGAPDTSHIDITFVAEGFREAELNTFERVTATLTRDFRRDVLEAMRPGLFRFHRLPAVSQSSDVTNADGRDTALGACLQRDELDGSMRLHLQNQEALELVKSRFPQVDAVVVLVNTPQGRANAELHRVSDTSHAPIIRLSLADSGRVLTHELGHSLFSLGDEYSDSPDALPPEALLRGNDDPLVETPNLSVDPSGAKWSAIVSGAVPGGMRYGKGVWHATSTCRMNRTSEPFCPVCAHEVARVLQVFEGTSPPQRPACGLKSPQPERLTLEDVMSATPFVASDVEATTWVRVGCEAPCPVERPAFLFRAGAGWLVPEQLPPGWTPREAECAAACRYPGDGPTPAMLGPAAGAPRAGTVDITCQSSAGLTRVVIPYGP